MNIIQVYRTYPTHEACLGHLEAVRWKGTPICPYCHSKRITGLKNEHRYHCNECNISFSVTVNTIFHKTKVDLQKWFLAIALVLNAKKGMSARQLARDLEVNKNTGWYMLMRLRKAMLEQGELLRGIVEVDETYVGGKDKNRHKNNRGGGRGRGSSGKTPVAGTLQRGGKVMARKVKDASARSLKTVIYDNVEKGSTLMTDDWTSYQGLSAKFEHLVVNHGSGEYVKGNVHTNSIEGFWSLFKRGIVGQYHQISKRHIDKYLDEFCFRHNYRETDKAFSLLLNNALNLS